MKFLTKVKYNVLRIWRSMFFKYAVVSIIGILVVGFLDDNSVWGHLKNLRQIQEMTEEREKYNAEFERCQAQIKELEKNPKAMEKIARERYFMKADNEDIFILSDDDRVPKSLLTDETVE